MFRDKNNIFISFAYACNQFLFYPIYIYKSILNDSNYNS